MCLASKHTTTVTNHREDATLEPHSGLTGVKDKDSGFERVLLGFKDEKLRKMELYDSFNHITLITFDGVERNPALQDSTFLFTPPKGVDVVGE